VTGTAYIYNNVIRGNAGNVDGINVRSGATATIKNNAIFNLGDDISNSGTATVQYNAADDDLDTEFTESTNINPSGSDWANEFVNAAAGDFTLLNTGNLYQGGTDVSLATDMDGDAYHATTPSIGVDEYVAAGGANAPTGVLMGSLWGPLAGPIGD
jgi:hypothetical protein